MNLQDRISYITILLFAMNLWRNLMTPESEQQQQQQQQQ